MRMENQKLADYIKTGISRIDSTSTAIMCKFLSFEHLRHALMNCGP